MLVARSFQNPASAFAQGPRAQGPQHVIVDGVQNVMIDGISPGMRTLPVTIEDVSSTSGSLPVMTANPLGRLNADPLGRNALHVVIDDLDSRLSLSGGLPVSIRNAASKDAASPTRWEYKTESCAPYYLGEAGALGWELVMQVYDPPRLTQYLTQTLTPQDKNGLDRLCMAFLKRPLR